MYAVIRTGGKQYKVKAGDIIRVELLEKSQGDEFDMQDVLFVAGSTSSFIGEPTVAKAKVTVVVTKQDKAKKILVFKKKRRQGYSKMRGHRQNYTELFVKSITAPDGQTETAEKRKPTVQAKPIEEKVKAAPKKKAAKATPAKKKVAKKKVAKKVTKKKATKKVTKKK